MTIISNSKFLPYNAKAIFNVVADIKEYPRILRNISSIKINREQENFIDAKVKLSFSLISVEYDCDINLYRDYKITVTATKGPFKYLNAEWNFKEKNNNCTFVEYSIDFQFRSLAMHMLASKLIKKSAEPTIRDFEKYMSRKINP